MTPENIQLKIDGASNKPTIVLFDIPDVQREDQTINCTYAGLLEYSKIHGEDIVNDGKACAVKVSRETGMVSLVRNTHGGYTSEGSYRPRTEVKATLQSTDDAVAVGKLLDGEYAPQNLGQKLRKLQHLFLTEAEHATVVKKLTSWKAEIESVMEDVKEDSGHKRKLLDTKFKEEQDMSFVLNFQRFKGMGKVEVKVMVLFDVTNTGVTLALYAPQLVRLERDAAENAMNQVLTEMKKSIDPAKVPYIEQ